MRSGRLRRGYRRVPFGWRSFARWAASQGHPSELVSLTSSLYAARELAVQRLQYQAARLGASGVIDVKVLERSDVWGTHVIEFVAYGTAVYAGRISGSFDPKVLVMLNDGDSRDGRRKTETFYRTRSTRSETADQPSGGAQGHAATGVDNS